MSKAKILYVDIETTPTKAYVWGLWKQNIPINMIEDDWFVLSWAAKWADEKEVLSDSMFNHYKHFLHIDHACCC